MNVEEVVANAKKVCREMRARQAEARRMANTKEDKDLGVHQCEICYTRGVGEGDLNLICNPCRDNLPDLLKSSKDTGTLRAAYMFYLEAVDNRWSWGNAAKPSAMANEVNARDTLLEVLDKYLE